MKIWHISDTHSFHKLLTIPEGIDMVIHSGDFSNYKEYYKNEPEMQDFMVWYAALPIKYKILIAGNHDAVPAIDPAYFRDLCNQYNIIYLENETIEIEGIKIFGTPITPTFGNWYFNKSRDKLDRFWKHIPEDTDILVVHGPPRGVLDLSYNQLGNVLEFCGCKALKRHVIHRLNLKMCLFGHIHNTKDIINQGTLQLSGKDTIFSNGSVVTDGKFGTLSSNGNILDYKI
jgi:Icc-related predicted phosphoesterase